MIKKIIFYVMIPLGLTALFTLLALTPIGRQLEYNFHDTLLSFKPPVKEDDSILFININDEAIQTLGMFPWSRKVFADGLYVMQEFDPRFILFDIEFTDPSPLGFNSGSMKEVNDLVRKEIGTINEQTTGLIEALQNRQIPLGEAGDFLEDLIFSSLDSEDRILDKVENLKMDNDAYFGAAAVFAGNAYFTVNMMENPENLDPELKEYTLKNIAYPGVIKNTSNLPQAVQIRPAILPLISAAKGAGFPLVDYDEDGVLRDIHTFFKYEGAYFPQLVFAPLLDMLGKPEIEISRKNLTLKGARTRDGKVKDIVIPLTKEGKMTINWPQKTFLESFHHISYVELVNYQTLEELLLTNLKIMQESGYLLNFETDMLPAYEYARALRLNPENRKEYREVREYFFSEVARLFDGNQERKLVGLVEANLARQDLSEKEKARQESIRDSVTSTFATVKKNWKDMADLRTRFGKILKDAEVIIGWTGSSTTDLGVTPFDKKYMNVGTHGAVLNTVLQEQFLYETPGWLTILLGFLGSGVLVTILFRMNPRPAVLTGAVFIILFLLAGSLFFIFTGIYVALAMPLLTVFFSYLAASTRKFLITAREKSFLRNAFSLYLSKDVINELIADPEKLNLGGEKKELTAIFTDVKGFSSISEQLDPTDLVKLLNSYLTEMSNTILELKGTIDKYEGDAIIAFFGAPLPLENHAYLACLSAVRMKKMEALLNRHLLAENLTPGPLLTRIGINTGEMVVGNMGTAKKMDYTIMGHSVNLAARLEGVNKQYGTWILISERTYKAGGTDFLSRKLDRVRVVGMDEPVRLYELIDEPATSESYSTSREQEEGISIFNHSLALFEQREYKKAEKGFTEVLKLIPEDGPSKVYRRRCIDFAAKPPATNWDGVFNLKVK